MWHSKFRQIHFLMKNITDKRLILHLKGTDKCIWKSFVLSGSFRALGWCCSILKCNPSPIKISWVPCCGGQICRSLNFLQLPVGSMNSKSKKVGQ